MGELALVKVQIGKIILQIESNHPRKDVHMQIAVAFQRLKTITRLLAKYHLEVCIVEKHQRLNLPIIHENIDEIIKTYRYLS